VLRTVLTLESAWAEYKRRQAQWPKWCAVIVGAVRIDGPNRRVVFKISGPSVEDGDTSHLRGTREQAVARLTEILRDPMVAAEGYNASVAWMRCCDSSGSGVFKWVWRVFADRLDPSGFADTYDEALRKLAEWVLDNVMKEAK
jgi:hypothetical protein